MMVNIIIELSFLVMQRYTLVNFVKRSKRKMRRCSLNKSCQSKTCSPDMEQVAHIIEKALRISQSFCFTFNFTS